MPRKPPDHIGSRVPVDLAGEIEMRHLDLRKCVDEVAYATTCKWWPGTPLMPLGSDLQRLACQILDGRSKGGQAFAPSEFGKPAWDILITLYCAPSRHILIGSVALNRRVDLRTEIGSQWQTALRLEGWLERGPPGLPEQIQNIRLTRKGHDLMDAYLTRAYYSEAFAPVG